MKNKILKIAIILATILATIYTSPSANALASTGTVTGGTLNVRTGAGTSYNLIDTLANGTVVNLVSEVADSSGTKWYVINYYNSSNTLITGYVHGNYIQENITYTEDVDFESYLTQQGFPESYKVELRKLHALYPNWVFQAIHTNLDWSASVASEYGYDVSLTQSIASGDRSTASWSYDASTGAFKVFDGSNWYAASESLVAYYLDPRNFLTVSDIFMFEKLTYSTSHHTETAVKQVLSGSVFESLASEFVTAGKTTNVSPIHLATRVIQEQGKSGSYTSSGKAFTYNGNTYSGYYNLFNIGATSGSDNWVKALIYARDFDNVGTYGRPWDTTLKSITGGAMFLSESYISKGQDTIYFQRFNVAPYTTTSKYRHQYMTNIAAAASEGLNTYSAYNKNGLLKNSFVFAIPVYLNMPNDDSGTNTGSNTNTNNYPSTLGWTNDSGYVSGFSLGRTINNLSSSITASFSSASVSITSSNGTAKSGSSILCTGDKINISENGNKTTYAIVIYGDVNGDGAITTSDLLAVRKHILGTTPLSGAYLRAGNVTRKSTNTVTTSDLLAVRKHILGSSSIKQ